jgi:hypothetical protein
MSSSAIQNFMRQQGFGDEPPDACNMHFAGLYFQPRIVFAAVLLAVVFQSAWLFLAIGAVLWWNVLFTEWNPFERAYNRFVAAPRGTPPLTPAPGPRRFAQAVNAAFNTGAGACLLLGLPGASWLLQAGLVAAFSALLFAKFCLGAWMYHVLRGELAFANSTLPWARPRT